MFECTAATRSRPSAMALGCSVSRYASQASSVAGRFIFRHPSTVTKRADEVRGGARVPGAGSQGRERAGRPRAQGAGAG